MRKATPLDRAALIAIVLLVAALAVILARGDRVGAQIVAFSPADGGSVSTRPTLSITFSEPMATAEVETRLRMDPPVSLTLRWAGRTVYAQPQTPLLANTPYTLTVRAGAVSLRGRAQLGDFALHVRPRPARIAFMAPATGVPNLVVAGADGAGARQITSEAFGVFDFAIRPDGEKIVYSATRNAEGIRDLWLINPDGSGRERIVSCDDQACQSAAWLADGAQLVYERKTMTQGAIGRVPGAARIWLYDAASKDTAPLSADTQQLGALPRPAPSGAQIAYYDSNANAIALVDTQTGERQNLPSLLGDPGAWSPDAGKIIFPNLASSASGDYSQLFLADLARGEIAPFATMTDTNDISARWSPLGNRVAFTRQDRSIPVLSGSFAPIGPQIWVALADGTRARQMTHDAEFSFGGLVWHPDGGGLAAVKIHLLTPDAKPEVWTMDADGANTRRIAQDATLPEWLP